MSQCARPPWRGRRRPLPRTRPPHRPPTRGCRDVHALVLPRADVTSSPSPLPPPPPLPPSASPPLSNRSKNQSRIDLKTISIRSRNNPEPILNRSRIDPESILRARRQTSPRTRPSGPPRARRRTSPLRTTVAVLPESAPADARRARDFGVRPIITFRARPAPGEFAPAPGEPKPPRARAAPPARGATPTATATAPTTPPVVARSDRRRGDSGPLRRLARADRRAEAIRRGGREPRPLVPLADGVDAAADNADAAEAARMASRAGEVVTEARAPLPIW